MKIPEIKNKFKNIVESKTFRGFVYAIGILFVAFLIFQAGMVAGFKKASFGRDWGNNYAMNFGSPHKDIRTKNNNMGDFGNLPNAHGAIGKIIKIELPTIIVLDPKDNTEKVVLINDQTEIRNMRETILSTDLKLDTHIIVVGSPNSSGQIEAKLIRFIPAPLPLLNKEIN